MTSPRFQRPTAAHGGFTLIEVLSAVVLSSIVIATAVAFQINLGNAMKSSRERLRTERHAVALLDRIARDLRGAYFITPSEGGDQRAHPWVFRTEQHFGTDDSPADALKFVTRNYVSPGLDEHSSDLAVVAYYLSPMPDAPAFELVRWRSTHMPIAYEPDFPELDDPDVQVMGEGIAMFGITLIDDTGAELPFWDGVRLGSRAGLPNAVRLEIVMADPVALEEARFEAEPGDDFEPEIDFDSGEAHRIFSKLVVLPLRPLDWAFLESDLEVDLAGLGGQAIAGEDGEDGDESEDDDAFAPLGVDDDGFDFDEDEDFEEEDDDFLS